MKMNQQGFEDYTNAVFGHKTGTAASYISAIRIIDEMFEYNDVFALKGCSLTCIEDAALLVNIADFILKQQRLFKKGDKSFFSNINNSQTSYPRKGFCSAAVNQLLKYHKYSKQEQQVEKILETTTNGTKVSKDLVTFFELDKEGKDVHIETKARLGQNYFRKMVLTNYQHKCCVTGLNVPQALRASHIVAWAEDKRHRMDPENGLCLSATYDAAFDKHLISFDNDYRMIVSKEIKEYYTNDVTKAYFEKFEGKQIILPQRFLPNKKLLEKHRDLLIV